MPVTSTIAVLLLSLAILSFAISRLARSAGLGPVAQASGIVAAGIGLLVFLYAPGWLPLSRTRYAELLGFGTAYLGQAFLVLWLSFKSGKRD